MTTYNLERIQVFLDELGGASGTVLMIDAMETVSANSLFVPLVRTRIHLCNCRHVAMKAGVENGELRHVSQQLCDNLDTFEFGLNVQRSKL